MYNEGHSNQYNQPISRVLNYILTDLKGDLSLKKLAGIANYSHFHFQKIFKEAVGQTPKQFVILTRLKSAIAFLMVSNPRPISEIAFECGFSAPSVFAKTFKNHFGISAEKLRAMPAEERIRLITCESFVKELLHHELPFSEIANHLDMDEVIVKNIGSIRGIFTDTSLRNKEFVTAFRKSVQLAETSNIDLNSCGYIGMIYPHHDLYRAVVSFCPVSGMKKKENCIDIKPGRYATFKVTGQIEATFMGMNVFYRHWLPDSGYRIADVHVFEILANSPVNGRYGEMEREVYIPIEPI